MNNETPTTDVVKELAEKKLEEKLNKIIDPLFQKAYEYFYELASGHSDPEECEVAVKELFSIAILEGVNLAELVDDNLDKELASKLERQGEDFASKVMMQDNKLLNAKIALNLNDKSGKFKRFVTPDELDEKGDLKK